LPNTHLATLCGITAFKTFLEKNKKRGLQNGSCLLLEITVQIPLNEFSRLQRFFR